MSGVQYVLTALEEAESSLLTLRWIWTKTRGNFYDGKWRNRNSVSPERQQHALERSLLLFLFLVYQCPGSSGRWRNEVSWLDPHFLADLPITFSCGRAILPRRPQLLLRSQIHPMMMMTMIRFEGGGDAGEEGVTWCGSGTGGEKEPPYSSAQTTCGLAASQMSSRDRTQDMLMLLLL